MKKQNKRFLMAALAGIGMGLSALPTVAQDEKGDVKCWGINGCASHAKCSVKADDLAAFKALLGDKDFQARYGKSEAHACASHAKCGASSQILNWEPTSLGQCKAKAGYVVEEIGSAKKKVAKKA